MTSSGLGLAHRNHALVALAALLLGACLSHTRDADDAGSDAYAASYDACRCDAGMLNETGPGPDASAPPASCEPANAHAMLCPAGICDGFDSYVWNGERCVMIDCGTCEGPDCEHAAHSMEACVAAHAACEPALCEATGGEWLFWVEECEHYRCGQPQLATCLVGRPVCDCGFNRSFVVGTGCVEDPTCPDVDPLPPDQLCAATGGTWTPGICCHTECGQFCGAECAAPACVCGVTQSFDLVRGCVDTAECRVRAAGDACDEEANVRCEDGLICCPTCGGAGCDPVSHCRAPLCTAVPELDVCGNSLIAP